ncbi:MAG: alkaline phosphatase D family protein [Bdellovibrionales bacterium]
MKWLAVSLFVVFFINFYAKASETSFEMVFGSCLNQRGDLSIMDEVLGENASYFISLGDMPYSAYGESNPMGALQIAFDELEKTNFFPQLFEKFKVLGMWDDHDYGLNDGGRENPIQDKAQDAYLRLFRTNPQDKRFQRKGLYHEELVETKDGKQIQILMLDSRSFRSKLEKDPAAGGKRRYRPSQSQNQEMLGSEQWDWLKLKLKKSVDLRIVVSSIQVLAKDHGFEKWWNLPIERDRLLNLLAKNHGKEKTIILSGDRHYSSFYKQNLSGGMKLYELTSSGLNKTVPRKYWGKEKDRYHVSGKKRIFTHSYGTLKYRANGSLTLEIKSKAGRVLESLSI